jgi:hypothetical protein
MAKTKKKADKGKKRASKSKKAKPSVDLKTESTAISEGAMKDAFRQAFLRREI